MDAGEARERNAAAWARARRQRGTVHVGERTRRQSWTLRRDRQTGFARVGYCRSCHRPYVESRVYWSQQYAVTGTMFNLVVGARTRQARRLRAMKCNPCKAEALRARQALGTNQARRQARAEARAGRTCAVCQAPLTSERATRRFCSVRCRVAAWRNDNGRSATR
jgi:hypothetical protein